MPMPDRMDLKTDYAFKQVFGQPQTTDILIAFLNALLPRDPADRIIAIDLANTELVPAWRWGKGKRLDIYGQTDRGERINVEIQLGRTREMPQRTLLYWSSLYETQATAGQPYAHLHRTITINLLNFVILPSTARYHTSYHLYEDTDRSLLTNVLEIHFVELPKFRRYYRHQVEPVAKDPLGRWLLLLDAAGNSQIRHTLEESAMVDPTLDHALNVWEAISRDPEHWAGYLSQRKALLDELSREYHLREAQQATQKAREEGLAEGIEQGLEQGLVQGLKRGVRQIARALLADGDTVGHVMKVTGLGADEIAALQQPEP